MRPVSEMLSNAGHAFHELRIARAPLVVSVFGGLVLAFPKQTHEIYRIMAEAYVGQPRFGASHLRVWLTLLSTIIATSFVWVSVRYITAGLERPTGLLAHALRRWLPALSAVCIPVGMAIGLRAAAADSIFWGVPDTAIAQFPALQSIQTHAAKASRILDVGVWVCVGIAFAILVMNIALLRRTLLLEQRTAILVSIALGIVLVALIALWPVRFPQSVGAMFIFHGFLLVLVSVLSAITVSFDQYRIPVLLGLAFAAVLFASLDLNDNHVVRPVQIAPAQIARVNVDQDKIPASFEAWYRSRKDLNHYKEGPYPVFVVAAAGGGIYAAQHAATVLARLQDRCPNFAQHVFAISSVSGGSLGAAVFTSLAGTLSRNSAWEPCRHGLNGQKGEFEKRSEKFLDNDFLSPVVAAGLFPDLLQRLLPVAIPSFDRARPLDRSIELAWDHALPESRNFFVEPFLAQWRPEGAAPALLLNATDVDSGERVVIAPFLFNTHEHFLSNIGGGWAYTPLAHLHQISGWQTFGDGVAPEWRTAPGGDWARAGPATYDIRLSTAVGVSARFPWILPAATIERQEGPFKGSKRRIVDGAYFENSGIETALDLINQLKVYETPEGAKRVGSEKVVRVTLLIIGADAQTATPRYEGMNEILAPIRTMLSVREDRGDLAAYRSFSRVPCYQDVLPVCDNGFVLQAKLNAGIFQLPLGWRLSSMTRDLIGVFGGNADAYNHKLEAHMSITDDSGRLAHYISAADKVACTVHHILSGRVKNELLVPECNR